MLLCLVQVVSRRYERRSIIITGNQSLGAPRPQRCHLVQQPTVKVSFDVEHDSILPEILEALWA
jgi:hypothetical protein